MLYIVTYNINTTIKNYTSLYEAIKQLSISYQHPMESVWFIFSDYTAHEISKILKEHMLERDNIFVAELTRGENVNGWMPKPFWNWFNDKMK